VPTSAVSEEIKRKVEESAENFLRLEKYVNLNFTGFHKILKKHDRHLPNPCKAFYLARLHDQSWVRGDYSDILVSMSRVYSAIRGDTHGEKKDDEKQVRTYGLLHDVFVLISLILIGTL
jgi:SPX domain protein involved in polyphosphate accumulation